MTNSGHGDHLPGSAASCTEPYTSSIAPQTHTCPPPIELSEADASDVASLFARCADYFHLQDGLPPTLDDANALFTDVPPDKDARDQTVLGWKDGDGLFAVAAILRDYPRDGTWYLGFMLVDAPRRGGGLGRSLYAAIEQWAAARGSAEIRLAVLEANEAGGRFWRSRGFAELRRVGPDMFKTRSHSRIEFGRKIGGSLGESGNR